MQNSQGYILTIKDMFAVSGGAICGADATIAIMDGEREIDSLTFSGKVGPGGQGARLTYNGKPGLTAKVTSGPGSITMASVLN